MASHDNAGRKYIKLVTMQAQAFTVRKFEKQVCVGSACTPPTPVSR
jgi:hypothetical protein